MAKKATKIGGNRNAPNNRMGRPKGALNKTTVALKEAILLAAEEHGEDDKGKDGLKGYLRKIAREDTKAFSALLGRVLPMTVQGPGDNGEHTITFKFE